MIHNYRSICTQKATTALKDFGERVRDGAVDLGQSAQKHLQTAVDGIKEKTDQATS